LARSGHNVAQFGKKKAVVDILAPANMTERAASCRKGLSQNSWAATVGKGG